MDDHKDGAPERGPPLPGPHVDDAGIRLLEAQGVLSAFRAIRAAAYGRGIDSEDSRSNPRLAVPAQDSREGRKQVGAR